MFLPVVHRELSVAARQRMTYLSRTLSAGIPAVIDWQDIERADKMARRASGLDSDDAPKVNVNLNLVNQRILAMQQAPD